MSEDFHLPAFDFGVVLVHFEQVAGEQGRFVAAGAGADFHDDARAVGVFAADGQVQAARSTALRARRAAAAARPRPARAFGVVAVDHLLRFGDLVVELLEPAILLGQLAERAVLAGDGRDARRIRQDLGVHEVCFELLEAGQFLFE